MEGTVERRAWLVGPQAVPFMRRAPRADYDVLAELRVGRVANFLLDPATLGVLRWPVPDGVEAVTIEKGRVVIRIAS